VETARGVLESIGRDSYRIESVIGSAIEDIVLNLAFHGEAFYEILQRSSESGIELSSFSPERVWTLPSFYVQLAPQDKLSRSNKRFVLMPKETVWCVRIPKVLGGTTGYRRILGSLKSWSGLGPKFLQEDLEKRSFPRDFDFEAYRRMFLIHQMSVTADWGWNGRDWSLDHVTEYYQFYRHLTFKWAQAVLRDHVVTELNLLLRDLGINVEIAIRHFPTPEHILETREKLHLGVLDFTGATNAIR